MIQRKDCIQKAPPPHIGYRYMDRGIPILMEPLSYISCDSLYLIITRTLYVAYIEIRKIGNISR
jgi:hypothetical protein